MTDTNKKIRLDLDINESEFTSKFSNLIDKISQLGNKSIVGENFLSQSDKLRLGGMRASDMENSLKDKYSWQRIEDIRKHGGQSSYFRPEDRLENQKIEAEISALDNLKLALEEATATQRMAQFEEKARHREMRSKSVGELKDFRDQARKEARELERDKRFDEADAKYRDVSAAESAIRDKTGMTSQERFIRQMGYNMIGNQMFNVMGQLYGGHVSQAIGAGQTGYNAFSGARMAGMGGMGAGALGLGVAAVTEFINLFVGASKIEESQRNIDRLVSLKSETTLPAGFKDEDFKEGLSQYIRRTGRGYNIQAGYLEELGLERGFGMSPSDLQAFTMNNPRENGYSGTEGLVTFTRLLQKQGGGVSIEEDSRNLARMPKYLEKLVNLQEGIYQNTGERNRYATTQAMQFLGAMVGQGGIFGEADMASRMVNSVKSAFISPKSEEHRFFNYSAIKDVYGNISPLELALKSQNMNDLRVVNASMNALRSRFGVSSGNQLTGVMQESFYREAATLLGLDPNSELAIAKQFADRGNISGVDLQKINEGKKSPEELFKSSVDKFTTSTEKTSADLNNILHSLSEELVPALKSFNAAVSSFVGYLHGSEPDFRSPEKQRRSNVKVKDENFNLYNSLTSAGNSFEGSAEDAVVIDNYIKKKYGNYSLPKSGAYKSGHPETKNGRLTGGSTSDTLTIMVGKKVINVPLNQVPTF